MSLQNPASHKADATTGVTGLDDILGGGFVPKRMYLLEGDPGAGKTTLALQFLLHGAANGESGLYITLSETKEELYGTAASHGWDLGRLEIVELAVSEDELDPENQYAMFQPSELELSRTTKTILDRIERSKPKRVVIDSLSEIRLLAQNGLRYRRQILALKQFFAGRSCTVLLLDDRTSEAHDLQLHSIAHGVVSLDHLSPEYGSERRRVRITKFRGRKFRGGYHDFTIETGGLQVFPRLVAAEHALNTRTGMVESGISELDSLLGGGVDSGSSVLIVGPAGSGKTSLAIQYAHQAAMEGKRAAVYSFDERTEILCQRAAGLGLDLSGPIANGLIKVYQIDPAEVSPGEFAQMVRKSVDEDNVSMVIIDTLNGYLNAMPEERFLVIQLHELFTYLGHKGVTTFLIAAQHGLIGTMQSPVDTTYLADTVILLRYFEAHGEVRQALSVMKKRTGRHERSIREFRLDHRGLRVGAPLTEFHGILTGVPRYSGASAPLLSARDE